VSGREPPAEWLVDREALAQLYLRLQQQGCECLGWVTATHQLPFALEALFLADEQGLRLPLVYNSSGYERLEVLELLDSIVDVYLADFKYGPAARPHRLCQARDYFSVAGDAVAEMRRQVGDLDPQAAGPNQDAGRCCGSKKTDGQGFESGEAGSEKTEGHGLDGRHLGNASCKAEELESGGARREKTNGRDLDGDDPGRENSDGHGPDGGDAGSGPGMQGLVVRHLVLPGDLADTPGVLETLALRFGSRITVSLMGQYLPPSSTRRRSTAPASARRDSIPAGSSPRSSTGGDSTPVGSRPAGSELQPPLDRPLRREEYEWARELLHLFGLRTGWAQELEACEVLNPDFTSKKPFEG
jgi:hypothetical protein